MSGIKRYMINVSDLLTNHAVPLLAGFSLYFIGYLLIPV